MNESSVVRRYNGKPANDGEDGGALQRHKYVNQNLCSK